MHAALNSPRQAFPTYNPIATYDPAASTENCICLGDCDFDGDGHRRRQLTHRTPDCNDNTASNYNQDAVGQTECEYDILGCTNSLGTNCAPKLPASRMLSSPSHPLP